MRECVTAQYARGVFTLPTAPPDADQLDAVTRDADQLDVVIQYARVSGNHDQGIPIGRFYVYRDVSRNG